MLYLDILASPVTAGIVTVFTSLFILRYLKTLSRAPRERASWYAPLFALCNGVVVCILLFYASGSAPLMIAVLVALALALTLENFWLSDTSVSASTILGNSILQNYLSLYFVSCSLFRLCPTDNHFRTTGTYRTFVFSLCSILCIFMVNSLRAWFPNGELKISLYSKSYSPLLRMWLPISNLLTALCTLFAMPMIPLHGLDRTFEVAFFMTLLAWMLANLAASYLITLVQCWRVRQNERANNASMTIQAMRQDFMLSYLANVTTDEVLQGRELFHMDGTSYRALLKRFVSKCIHPDDAAPFLEKVSQPGYYEMMLETSPRFEVELRCSKHGLLDLMVLPEDAVREISSERGTYLWILVQSVVTRTVWGEILINAGIKNINEAKRQQAELQRSAETNPLTGLLNRRGWGQRVRERLAAGDTGMLAIIDLDHFKDVNDNLGHQEGDLILKETADILRSSFRANDLIGHIGGDEFCVFAGGLSKREDLGQKLDALLAQRRKSYTGKDGKEKSLSFSIGIALIPEHGVSMDELVHHADTALYTAKESGRDCYRIYEAGPAAEALPPRLIFTKSLETGHEMIDSEHRRLFDLVNELTLPYPPTLPREEVEKAVDFLLGYTEEHFRHEEELQRQFDYPDFQFHKQLHDDFRATALTLAARLKEDTSEELGPEISRCFKNWLIDHVKGADRKLAEYVRAQQEAPEDQP